MKLGMDNRAMTGASLALRIWQLTSLIPLFYVAGATVQLLSAREGGFFGWLLGAGICAMPRAEALALAFAYRLTAGEVILCLAPAVVALAVGIPLERLLRNVKQGVRVRWAIVIFWAVDILAGLLPLAVNAAFGTAAAVPGLLIRLGCLALTAADLCALKKGKAE